MGKPHGLGEEYSFPSDAGRLSSTELGTMQLKLSGWYSYLLREIGREEARLGVFQTVYDIALGVKMQALSDGYSTHKPVKENLRALALAGDDRLNTMLRAILTKTTLIRRLTAQSDIYHEQITRLSREQSRREAEARLG